MDGKVADVMWMLHSFEQAQTAVVLEHERHLKDVLSRQWTHFRSVLQEAQETHGGLVARQLPVPFENHPPFAPKRNSTLFDEREKGNKKESQASDDCEEFASVSSAQVCPAESAQDDILVGGSDDILRKNEEHQDTSTKFQKERRSSKQSGHTAGSLWTWRSHRKSAKSAGSWSSATEKRQKLAHEYNFHVQTAVASHPVLLCCDQSLAKLSQRRLGCEWLAQFIEGWIFQLGVCLLILLNAAFIAWRTQRAVDLCLEFALSHGATSTEDSFAFVVVENCFNGVFTVELLMRLLAYEGAFFTGPEWKWNMLDMILVVPSVVEFAIQTLEFNISFMRTLRLLRMLRTLRMIRIMRFAATFRHLRLMLLAVLKSLVPLFWAIFFLTFLMFLFAVMFMQGTAQYLANITSAEDQSFVPDMQEFFTTLPMMLLTLLLCISGGISWWEIATIVRELGVGYLLMFILFILIMLIVVLNIITGIFVNESIETASKDHDLIVQMEVLHTRQMLFELQRLFEEIDGDADGSITLEEFENALRDQQGSVRGVFRLLDIDITDARDFFSVIDVDGSNRIEIDEFVMGCLRLKGNGHHLGLESVMQEHKKRLKDMNRRQERVEVKLHSIIDEMKGIRAMWDRNGTLVIRSEDTEWLKTRGRSFSA